MHATLPLLEATDFPSLRRDRLATLQVNLGYRCNQQCLHCHVNAGPRRTEEMDRETVDRVLRFARESDVASLDLTGGAPELNPHFRYLVERARAHGVAVIDRCNLTVLSEPGQADLADFLAAQRVEVVASMPCYQAGNVDGQRGKGVFKRSVDGLQRLNALGYGYPGSGRVLNLVYNPSGPFLPPDQFKLEQDYKQRLFDQYGIRFNRLFTMVNMPIARFGSTLVSKGGFGAYMDLLKGAFNSATLESVMCRQLLSVDWQGFVYDCDFNQMLGLGMANPGGARLHLADLTGTDLSGRPIRVADHCYGCAAGSGSSCGGALA